MFTFVSVKCPMFYYKTIQYPKLDTCIFAAFVMDANQGWGEGGQWGGGDKIPGLGLVRGPKILVKHLVMDATIKMVGTRNT